MNRADFDKETLESNNTLEKKVNLKKNIAYT